LTAVIEATATAFVAGIKLTFGDHRPWEVKWHLVRYYLERIRSAYSDPSTLRSNEDLEAYITAFFVECDNLRYWLKGDNSRKLATAIQEQWKDSCPLKWCSAICNTHKHYRGLGARRPARPGEKTAYVRVVQLSPEVIVTIELDWAGPNPVHVEAIKLAEKCFESWQQILSKVGITEPT